MNDLDHVLLNWHGDLIGIAEKQSAIEFKRAIWSVQNTFVFSYEYNFQPVVTVSLSFDYLGGNIQQQNITGMFPLIELLSYESGGILFYTGVRVTWVGNVPSALPHAYTNMVAIISPEVG